MSGLNYMKLGSTLNNICYTTVLDDATKCHYAFKNFWGEPRVGKHLTDKILGLSTEGKSSQNTTKFENLKLMVFVSLFP